MLPLQAPSSSVKDAANAVRACASRLNSVGRFPLPVAQHERALADAAELVGAAQALRDALRLQVDPPAPEAPKLRRVK